MSYPLLTGCVAVMVLTFLGLLYAAAMAPEGYEDEERGFIYGPLPTNDDAIPSSTVGFIGRAGTSGGEAKAPGLPAPSQPFKDTHDRQPNADGLAGPDVRAPFHTQAVGEL